MINVTLDFFGKSVVLPIAAHSPRLPLLGNRCPRCHSIHLQSDGAFVFGKTKVLCLKCKHVWNE